MFEGWPPHQRRRRRINDLDPALGAADAVLQEREQDVGVRKVQLASGLQHLPRPRRRPSLVHRRKDRIGDPLHERQNRRLGPVVSLPCRSNILQSVTDP